MLRQKLQQDQTDALKAGDRARLDTLRYLLSQVKNKEIETKRELTDEETIVVIRKNVKELKESLDSFQKGGRTDLAKTTEQQLAIVTTYLPQEISDQELEAEIKKVIEANKETAASDPKRMIGICVTALKNKAEPARIIRALQTVQT